LHRAGKRRKRRAKTIVVKISFSAAVLAHVVEELQVLIGGEIQYVAQSRELQIILSVFKRESGEKHLLLDASPKFYRAHLTDKRAPKTKEPSPFLRALQKHLLGGKITKIAQRGADRVLDLTIENGDEEFLLSAELMGKHANIILVSPENKILEAAKIVSAKQSRVRQVAPGREYSAPPAPPQFAKTETDSPAPNSSELDEYFSQLETSDARVQAGSTLAGSLRKTLKRKTQTLAQVQRGASQSARADEFQKFGDLILSQMHAIKNGTTQAELADYFSENAATISIPLNADLSPSQNAQKYFGRAKRARESFDEYQKLQTQLEREIADLQTLFAQVERNDLTSEEIEKLREKANARGWIRVAQTAEGSSAKNEKPDFGGFKIKRFFAPDGTEVLVGESATANDYLVTRLAHGNDWWLHLRGGVSAHAIIKTHGAPERVAGSTLEFAARLVIARSVAKHAGWAEVDYTLKKYVRKPRKAAPGSVVISHQKTLRVEPEK
jgi:predicted ribosome quality control (RQC) complex YloA/Tae2 family protein